MAIISTKEAGRRLGVSRRRVLQLIEDGRLKATRIGPTYVIDAKDLRAVRHRKPGRPRKRGKGKGQRAGVKP